MNRWNSHPLFEVKDVDAPSVFLPENLLREGRRQRGLADVAVPEVCVLDPDGDIVRYLRGTQTGSRHPGWACYHTEMWVTEVSGIEIGVVGCAVGASFAVLVAEQAAVSGCDLLVSITSSGLITPVGEPPYFVLIDRALRDEGTSAHYLPPSRFSDAPAGLMKRLDGAFASLAEPVVVGGTWTTDAPYRETQAAIDRAADEGLLAVEMEAAALYAYASAKGRDVVCLAHVTNSMAVDGDDFEKGAADGALAALEVVSAVMTALRPGWARHSFESTEPGGLLSAVLCIGHIERAGPGPIWSHLDRGSWR